MNLEKMMKKDKEKHQIALAMEVSLMETQEQVVAEFKESEEYKLAT